jgi:succinate-semialdehyde dehydrogenase / glutarate-semialdehyde dehydrogenase
MAIQSINPATGEILRTFSEFTPDQIDAALEQSHQAARRWRNTSLAQRWWREPGRGRRGAGCEKRG